MTEIKVLARRIAAGIFLRQEMKKFLENNLHIALEMV